MKFAIAASAKMAPGGPLWVNLAVPVELRTVPSADADVLVLAVLFPLVVKVVVPTGVPEVL